MRVNKAEILFMIPKSLELQFFFFKCIYIHNIVGYRIQISRANVSRGLKKKQFHELEDLIYTLIVS